MITRETIRQIGFNPSGHAFKATKLTRKLHGSRILTPGEIPRMIFTLGSTLKDAGLPSHENSLWL